MRKVYYKRMRTVCLAVPVFVVLAGLGPALHGQSAPSSVQSPALDSHEGFTVSARPLVNAAEYKEKFKKKSPYDAGIVAVLVTFRNDSDNSVKVGLERIRLNLTISDDQQQSLRPLSSEEVADAVSEKKSKGPKLSRSPFPLPIPKSSSTRDKNWTQTEKAAREAGITGSVVAPHSTLTGFLYFDLEGQIDLIDSSRLYVPDLFVLEKDHALTYFDIDLSRF